VKESRRRAPGSTNKKTFNKEETLGRSKFSSFKTQQPTRRDFKADPRCRHTLDKDQHTRLSEGFIKTWLRPNTCQ
jgi:hypothetical protein